MRVLAPNPAELGFSADRLGRIEVGVQRYIDRHLVSGVVCLVARRGEVVHLGNYGYLDIESGRAMPPDAIFRIASMTKPVTAAGVMQLLEEGWFELDDRIAEFIPEFARTEVWAGETANGIVTRPASRPITIRHLLTHTSGLTYPAEQRIGASAAAISVAAHYAHAGLGRWDETLGAKIGRLASMPLVHEPGEGWTYGYSIDVLGRLIEVVSGQSLDAYLQTRLFEPLGMVDTGFHVPAPDLPRLPTVYQRGDGGLVPSDRGIGNDPAVKPAFLMGGGGLFSTASDYGRFAQMLVNQGTYQGEQILGRKTVELMLTCQSRPSEIPVVPPAWGFREGWGMALGGRTLVDLARWGSPGSVGTYTWQGAYSTDFWVDPKEELLGVFLHQQFPDWTGPARTFRTLVYQALT